MSPTDISPVKKEQSANKYLSTNFSNKMKRNYETSLTGDEDHTPRPNDITVENLKEMEEVN